MGGDRSEVAAVLDSWPEACVTTNWQPDPEQLQDVVVCNVHNNLLDYPHKRWKELSISLGANRLRKLASPWRGTTSA
jgi:hypothetical protein